MMLLRASARVAATPLRRAMATLPPHVKVALPALSPTMETGNIAKWLKKEGETLKPGDGLAEIVTDKATVTFEFQDEAILAKIVKAEGSEGVRVGETIAITVDKLEDVAAFIKYTPDAAPASPAPAPAPAPAAAPPAPAAAPPAPAPAPSAKVAAPVAAATPQPTMAHDGIPYVAFEAWGTGLSRTPVSHAIARAQHAYVAAFGWTGFDPLPLPAEGGKAAAAGKK